MNWVIFCREGHPEGFGGLSSQDVKWDPEEETYFIGDSIKDEHGNYALSAAHGYITVVVLCQTREDVEVARDSVNGSWFQWDKRLDSWYGGRLDYVCAVPGPDRAPLMDAAIYPISVGYGSATEMPLWHSLGDNRAVAVMTLPQFLQQLYPMRYRR